MKYPARCNRRPCQARRNLSKRPEKYKRPPKCHVCGVGKMVVDEYRLRRGPCDHPPVCLDPGCDYVVLRVQCGKPFMPYHRVSTRGCCGHEEYVIDRAMVASKHSPKTEDTELDWQMPDDIDNGRDYAR